MEYLESLNKEYPLYRIVLSVLIFLFYLLIRYLTSRSIFKRALNQSFDQGRSEVVAKTTRIVITITFLLVVGLIWELSIKGLAPYVVSFLTVFGVALFATWSVMSNVTSSVILFFFFPFRVGSKIKVMDGDNSVEGSVLALTLFSIKIKMEDGTEIYYPNNLAIQKGIVHLQN